MKKILKDSRNHSYTHFKPLIDKVTSISYYENNYFSEIFYAFLIFHECAHDIDYIRNGIYFGSDNDHLSIFPKKESYFIRERKSMKYYKWLNKAKIHYNDLYDSGDIDFCELEKQILRIDSLYRNIPLEKVADEYALILSGMFSLENLILKLQ